MNKLWFLLYTRLETGRIMVWWCPSVRLSVRPSARFSYYTSVLRRVLLWYGDVHPGLRPSVRTFSALFSYMLWHIELKFCIWLCFNVLQIKFECRHFASIFEGVMPLCELGIMEMCSFPHFSPTCFDIMSWNFAHDFLKCNTDQVRVTSLCFNFWRGYASLWTQNIRNVQFSALFSYMLWHIELKFCIWLCFNVLQIKFECRHFSSIFEGVMLLCKLRI